MGWVLLVWQRAGALHDIPRGARPSGRIICTHRPARIARADPVLFDCKNLQPGTRTTAFRERNGRGQSTGPRSNLAEYADLPRREGHSDRVILGFVGFVRDWHGLDTVIAAMAAAGDSVPVDLIAVGDGPARADLERQAAALGLVERVRFTGLQAREQVPALVAGFDIALQPRVVEYASPLKIFEYMAAGRAIVAPDQENIREILRDGETALLFDPARPEAMWQAILRLAGYAALRQRLGSAARAEIVRRDYTWAGNARRVAGWARQSARRGVPTP